MSAAVKAPKAPKAPTPPPGPPLFRRASVYRRKLKLGGELGEIVAEFHEDKLVLRRPRARRKAEYAFAKLWALHTGQLV